MYFLPIIFLVVTLASLVGIIILSTHDKDGKNNIGTGCAFMLIFIITVPFLVYGLSFFWTKKNIYKKDIVGNYVIDREQFAGTQADWQYNHFRFSILENNTFLFYQMDQGKVIQVDTGKVSYMHANVNPRIVIIMDQTPHHIIREAPTLYRKTWSFYYVFESEKFGNVFFKKDTWEPI